MKMSLTTIGRTLASLSLCLLSVAAVSAQEDGLMLRAFVSATTGSDTNPCTRAAPCREVTRALDNVAPYGTVAIISSGDYNGFIIDRPVSIIAEKGVAATIVGSEGPAAIDVAIPAASSGFAEVAIKGLSIRVTFTGRAAVRVETRIFSLLIEDCEFEHGLYGLLANGRGTYIIRNSRFFGGIAGLYFDPGNVPIRATVENCFFARAGYGLFAGPNAEVTVRNSVATGNGTGFFSSGLGSKLFLENCLVDANNTNGIHAEPSSFVRISNCTITNNRGFGLRSSGAKARTYGNNRFANNEFGDTNGTVIQINQQ
jgi:parallel beta-helix repeat protein